MITQEELKAIFEYNPVTGVFHWIGCSQKARNGRSIGWIGEHGRIIIDIKDKKYKAHRLAFLYMNGRWPSGQIDHVNGNPSDNRWINLREASPAENSSNVRIHSDNIVGLKGIYKVGKRFAARITHNRQNHYLGVFDTPEEAHGAYCKAAIRLHGEFARAG